MIFVR